MSERNPPSAQAYGKRQADGYGQDPEHTLFAEELAVWLAKIEDLGLPTGARTLDFGAGTGALLTALKAHGLNASGLEPSASMIEQAFVLHPELEASDFKVGDADDEKPDDELFDLIVCRQVLCHLDQPERDFETLRGLLKPKGWLLLVDGFWPAKSWQSEQLAALPFSALTSAEPVGNLMRQLAFDIVEERPFFELNSARREAFAASKDRYLVVARRQ